MAKDTGKNRVSIYVTGKEVYDAEGNRLSNFKMPRVEENAYAIESILYMTYTSQVSFIRNIYMEKYPAQNSRTSTHKFLCKVHL